jgi:hypothetical protein
MTPVQVGQLDRVRAMFARAAHSDAQGEQEVAARMGMAFMEKYSFRSSDLLVGLRSSSEREYNYRNYMTAKTLLESPPPRPTVVINKTPPPNTYPFRRVWINGYKRKTGVEVKGYWRLTRPVWVESYTRKDGKKVAGHWRFSELKAAA